MRDNMAIVIGAGVIGTTTALELQRAGRRVLLIDRDEPGRGASFGNMASIAVSEFMPASEKVSLREVLGWLANPVGPVRIRPAYAFHLLPWARRFLASAGAEAQQGQIAALRQLASHALNDTSALLKEIGAPEMLSDAGCLSIYGSRSEFEADRTQLDEMQRHGFPFEILEGTALKEAEPGLGEDIVKAVRLPDNRSLADPFGYVGHIVARFQGLGGEVLRAGVRAVEPGHVILENGSRRAAGTVVIAAGARSGRFARQLGEPIPLESDRGYHTQIMAPGVIPRHALIWHKRAFMVTPTAGGVRVGGSVEFAGYDARPDYRRARALMAHAQVALPGLGATGASEWMGRRPALPDGLPIISASSRQPGVFYATGHGHLGLTQAATTARALGALVLGQKPEIDLAPFRIDRF